MSKLTKIFRNSYGTHRPILYQILSQTKGPVLECGCGFGSTPLLHELCSKAKRPLLTLESDRNWLKKFLCYQTPYHQLCHINNWETALNEPNVVSTNWDVVFVDQAPWEARYVTIKKLKNKAKYIILHDCDYFPENNIFGKSLRQLNGPRDRGERDYSDEFSHYKEFFPNEPWPDRLKGPPTLLASNSHSCEIKVLTRYELMPLNLLCGIKYQWKRLFQ